MGAVKKITIKHTLNFHFTNAGHMPLMPARPREGHFRPTSPSSGTTQISPVRLSLAQEPACRRHGSRAFKNQGMQNNKLWLRSRVGQAFMQWGNGHTGDENFFEFPKLLEKVRPPPPVAGAVIDMNPAGMLGWLGRWRAASLPSSFPCGRRRRCRHDRPGRMWHLKEHLFLNPWHGSFGP